jgi:hypothetical protein
MDPDPDVIIFADPDLYLEPGSGSRVRKIGNVFVIIYLNSRK